MIDQIRSPRTAAALKEAIATEAYAFLLYTILASNADKLGYPQAGDILRRLAENEKEHGEVWMIALGQLAYSFNEVIAKRASAESEESTSKYVAFERAAHAEGNDEIAEKFKLIGAIEGQHQKALESFFQAMKDNQVHRQTDETTIWRCRHCGNVVRGTHPPHVCPVCGHKFEDYDIVEPTPEYTK